MDHDYSRVEVPLPIPKPRSKPAANALGITSFVLGAVGFPMTLMFVWSGLGDAMCSAAACVGAVAFIWGLARHGFRAPIGFAFMGFSLGISPSIVQRAESSVAHQTVQSNEDDQLGELHRRDLQQMAQNPVAPDQDEWEKQYWANRNAGLSPADAFRKTNEQTGR
ncbi:MAG TPA: hypothetical protein VHX86_18685 [Tepidisphaeraceae bacterium]|jgi:hypothetical protein|nr:hypothetical protein [Tepidisphaeraceae bacterium]